MKTYSFPRRARLHSKVAIDRLFDHNRIRREHITVKSCMAYPLRAVWNIGAPRNDEYHGSRLLISIPKKKLRHAVDRVTMRRRIREAWRLSRPDDSLEADMDIALVYIATEKADFSKISASITKILSKLSPE